MQRLQLRAVKLPEVRDRKVLQVRKAQQALTAPAEAKKMQKAEKPPEPRVRKAQQMQRKRLQMPKKSAFPLWATWWKALR